MSTSGGTTFSEGVVVKGLTDIPPNERRLAVFGITKGDFGRIATKLTGDANPKEGMLSAWTPLEPLDDSHGPSPPLSSASGRPSGRRPPRRERDAIYSGWKEAVKRSRGWVRDASRSGGSSARQSALRPSSRRTRRTPTAQEGFSHQTT